VIDYQLPSGKSDHFLLRQMSLFIVTNSEIATRDVTTVGFLFFVYSGSGEINWNDVSKETAVQMCNLQQSCVTILRECKVF
jgi:hypothetical protein